MESLYQPKVSKKKIQATDQGLSWENPWTAERICQSISMIRIRQTFKSTWVSIIALISKEIFSICNFEENLGLG